MLLALAGCHASDEEIREDIAGKAMENLDFSGLDYTVKNGIVEFSGRCPSDEAFAKIQHVIKNIHVIRAVHYHVNIAPVVLDSLTPVKLQTDSILARYPQTIAVVNSKGITLKGTIAARQKTTLIQELRKHQQRPIKDSLTIY